MHLPASPLDLKGKEKKKRKVLSFSLEKQKELELELEPCFIVLLWDIIFFFSRNYFCILTAFRVRSLPVYRLEQNKESSVTSTSSRRPTSISKCPLQWVPAFWAIVQIELTGRSD
jgi:hypothetical protein